MEFNKRQLEQKIEDVPPRPNIIYKIRENQNRIRSKARPKAVFQALIGTITMVILLVVIGSAIATIKQVEAIDQVVIQSVASVAIQITEPTPWSGSIPHKIGGSEQQNKLVAYAYKISGQDRSFVYLLEAESGYNTDPRFEHPRAVNSVGTDWGYCGTNDFYHSDKVNDPRFDDWQYQIDTCYQMYDGGTTFYGLNRINDPELQDNFEFIAV